MKKILSLIAVCLLVVGFTSCNDDDDKYEYQSLTKEERAAQLRDMVGNYTGTLYYNVNEYTNRADSANISATITAEDSTMTISNLPIKIIAKRLESDRASKLDTTAVMPTLEANVSVYLPYGYLPEDSKLVHWFEFIPKGENMQTKFPVTYNGQDRVMTVGYTTRYNSYPSNGAFSGKRIVLQFIINSVAIDGEFPAQYIYEVMNARLTRQ